MWQHFESKEGLMNLSMIWNKLIFDGCHMCSRNCWPFGATEFSPGFLLEIVLSVLLWFTASDYPFCYLQTFRREKRREIKNGQSETQATSDTRHRTKTNKTKHNTENELHQKQGWTQVLTFTLSFYVFWKKNWVLLL